MEENSGNISLSQVFERACSHVKSLVGHLGSDKLLVLYAYYKQAKDGPCNIPKPHWFELTAKQKWEAWKELGNMDYETAMKGYISEVSALDPGWESRYLKEDAEDKENSVGWVSVSCLPNTDEYIADRDKTIFDWVKEGNVEMMLKLGQMTAVSKTINNLDDSGMGLIHWAADRGNLVVCKSLVEMLQADIDLQDEEGQTALHYAASCGHMDIIKYLLEKGANRNIKDSDGSLPVDVACDGEVQSVLRL